MRSEIRHDSKLFREISRSLLSRGLSIRFLARGRSMFPAISDGEVVQIEAARVRKGDVLLVDSEDGLRVHRLQASENNRFVTQGDCCFEPEQSCNSGIFGRVSKVMGNEGPRSPHRLARYLRRLRRLFLL